jgi:hypothetical protein
MNHKIESLDIHPKFKITKILTPSELKTKHFNYFIRWLVKLLDISMNLF